MFLLKKIVSALASPLALVLLLMLLAAFLRWRQRNRAAVFVVAASAVVLWLGSIDPTRDLLLAPLERAYPPLADDRALPDVQHVVVLGSNYWPDPATPITSDLRPTGIARAVEGVRIFRQRGLQHLVLSGGPVSGYPASALGYAELARSLGVDPEAITVLDTPRDTGQEAAAIRALLGAKPFILVTSASHMRRAMALMEREGLRAIPAPMGHDLIGPDGYDWRDWLPDGKDTDAIERALHEYVGLLALKLGLS